MQTSVQVLLCDSICGWIYGIHAIDRFCPLRNLIHERHRIKYVCDTYNMAHSSLLLMSVTMVHLVLVTSMNS